MRITALIIDSYKSFTQRAVLPLSSNFNVFIGPNNSGKTNIIDAIDFLTHPETDPSRLHHHRARLRMQVTFDENEKSKIGSRDARCEGNQYTVTWRSPAGEALKGSSIAVIGERVKRLNYEDFNDIDRITQDYTTLAQEYPDVFRTLTALVNDYFPEIESPDRVSDADSISSLTFSEGLHRSITIERLGSGFQRVLTILLYALHPDYSVILIDEPEIHLHPGMIKKIRKILQSTRANQIIITTHSPVFVRSSNLHQIYRVLKDEHGSHVYYLGQGNRRIDRRRLVQELNSDNVEMFFADKVLLVEGVSDRILMRGLIDRFYRGQDDIKVIYTHGKSNIDIYIDLMEIFHIPYVVMLDRDALFTVAHLLNVSTGKRRAQVPASYVLDQLRKKNIHILEKGSIEQNYPKKYQNKDTKPLNALYAASNITPAEYASMLMRDIRGVIQSL